MVKTQYNILSHQVRLAGLCPVIRYRRWGYWKGVAKGVLRQYKGQQKAFWSVVSSLFIQVTALSPAVLPSVHISEWLWTDGKSTVEFFSL